MASEELKTISSFELFNNQMNELKQIKINLEHSKTELITIQKKYEHYLSEYELKLEQISNQIEQIHQEQNEKEINLLNATSEWLDIKSKLEKTVVSSEQKIKLNIGGQYFQTTIDTLTKIKEKNLSYFQSLFSQQWQLEKDPNDESIFIDRDGNLFGYILQYFRTGQVSIDFDDALFRRDLIIEAEFYKIDSLIQFLKINNNSKSEDEKFYSNSKILSSDYQIQLNKLFGKDDQKWKLIYRAIRDGFTAKLFHQFCDNKGSTMTVIRSQNGYIFGGFTTIPWRTSGFEQADVSAFLFTLKNPFGIPPTKYPTREQATGFAVCHKPNNGPTFGSIENGGSDIFLHTPFNVVGSRIFFPKAYNDTTGKGRITFTGNSHFYSDDVEIFTFV